MWQRATQSTTERSRYFRHAMGGQRDDFLPKDYLFTDLGTRLNRELRIRDRGARTDATCNPGIPPSFKIDPRAAHFTPMRSCAQPESSPRIDKGGLLAVSKIVL